MLLEQIMKKFLIFFPTENHAPLQCKGMHKALHKQLAVGTYNPLDLLRGKYKVGSRRINNKALGVLN